MKLLLWMAALWVAGGVRAELFVVGFSDNTVRRYHEMTGAFIDLFLPSSLSVPHRVLVGADGHLLVANAGDDRVCASTPKPARFSASSSPLAAVVSTIPST